MKSSDMLVNGAAVLLAALCGYSCTAVPINNTPRVVSVLTEQATVKDPEIRLPVGSQPQMPVAKAPLPAFDNPRKELQGKVVNVPEEQADMTVFSDLPKLEINEDAFKGRQVIGHDELIESELKRLLSEFGDDTDEVPEIFLNEVKLYIRAFQNNAQYRKFIAASLKRSTRYMSTVKKILTNRNIPEDMAYIAFVESGFNPCARSRAGALGMWQFMPGTAKTYSLKVGKGSDERLDPVRSTYAASEYFHDLIAIFGPRSFLIALAAYNSGENRVISCLKRIDNPMEQRTFWHIRPCLAHETQEYPPKIIAAAIIGNNPTVFGFPQLEMMHEEVDIAREPQTAPILRQVALRTDVQPAQENIRTNGHSNLKGAKEQLHQLAQTRRGTAKPSIYTVKKGNALDDVAEAFRVSRNDIKRWNNLKSDRLLAGACLKVFPSVPLETVQYTVRKGDTISEIGESFGVRPVRIIVCNGLRDGVGIRPGQTIMVYKEMKGKPTIHNVKKGSNLARIAAAFDVRPKDIMRWNNLASASVFPNQKLRIYKNLKGA